ncbi:class I SAM-dependent methyltransferase [soil metagenome]
MVDNVFGLPRLAQVYDPLDPDRSDLDVYEVIVDELGARRVLDIGSGTGTLACRLALRGFDVIGLDPASASVDVARRKDGADQVRWVVGDVRALPEVEVDLVLMTANVAQVFVTDEDWHATLAAARDALAPGGHLVCETRVPEREGWQLWNPVDSYARADVEGIGVVTSETEVTEVALPLVSFRATLVFEADGERVVSHSTLRFRGREEITEALAAHGFTVREVRDAPDRPGREWVFVAERR